ncbi:MAG: DsbA family protein [Pseudomonadota bacterium]
MTRWIAAALLAVTLPLSASADSILDMTAAERQAFREEVRAYLLENPEVLMEAIAVLEQRQAEEQAVADVALLQANALDLFQYEGDWVGGNPDGDVTLVEFLDYRCGFCRRAHPEVTELVSGDGNIRLVVKEFPILGEASVLSSRFAIAVRQVAGDAAYKSVHDALIEMRGNPEEGALRAIATEAGVEDIDGVFVQMESPEVDAVIARNRALAQRLEINGTPSFVLGDQLLRGYLPLAAMQELVAEIRADG